MTAPTFQDLTARLHAVRLSGAHPDGAARLPWPARVKAYDDTFQELSAEAFRRMWTQAPHVTAEQHGVLTFVMEQDVLLGDADRAGQVDFGLLGEWYAASAAELRVTLPDAPVPDVEPALRIYQGAADQEEQAVTQAALRALHPALMAALPGLSRAAHHALLAVTLHLTPLVRLPERLTRYEQDAAMLGEQATRSAVSRTLAELHARAGQAA